MPNNVDERVVEMRIDHDNFESGAKKTISTLEKLEKALHLKSDTSGIDALERSVKNFDASPMTSGLEKISAGFSALEVVGMRVISNLTDSIYNFTARTIKDFTIAPVAEGFKKFGDKTTSVATLTAQGYELEKVNELMEQLNWFTDETSYNFTDMVSNIAKFTATGQDLDDSVTAMEGIALWAALSGQGATKASQAMYQLSQAMGKGALKYDDWRSIQNASMDTQEFRRQAVAAAEALGVLKEVGEDTWEVVGQNKQFDLSGLFSSDAMSRTLWFNSDVMMDVFNKYSKAATEIQRYQLDRDLDTASEAMEELEREAGELANTLGITLDEAFQQIGYDLDEFSLKAFKAGQQARTWGDVVDSVKDAVSTGWMKTFELMFGDAEESIQFFTDLANKFYEIFAEGGNIRNSIFKYAFGTGDKVAQEATENAISGWQQFEQQLASTGNTMEDFEKAYQEVARMVPEANLQGTVTKWGSLQAAFENGAISADIFNEILGKLEGKPIAIAGDIADATELSLDNFEQLKEVARGILRGDYGNGSVRKQMIEELGYDYEAAQMMAEIMYNNGQGYIEITDELLKSEYPTLYAKLLKETNTQLGTTDELLAQSSQIYDDILKKAGGVAETEEQRRTGSSLLKEGIENLLDAVIDVQGALRGAMTDVFGTDKERGDRIWNLVNAFHSLTERVGFSEEALLGFQKVLAFVLTLGKTAGSVLLTAFGIGQEIFFFFADMLDDILKVVGKGNIGIGSVLEAITNKFQQSVPVLGRVLNAVKKVIKELFKLLPFYDQLSKGDFSFLGLDKLAKSINNFSLKKLEDAVPIVKTLHDWFSKLLVTIESDDFSLFNKDLDKTNEKVGLLSTILGELTRLFKSVKSGFLTTLTSFNPDFSGINAAFQKFYEIVSFLFEGLFGNPEEIKTTVSNFVTTIWNGFLDGIRKLTFKDVVAAIRLTMVASIVGELLGVLSNLKKTAKEIKGIPESISEMFSSIGEAFTNLGKSFKANMYIKIAVAMGILAAAIWGLSKVPADKLTHILVTLGLFMLLMSKLMKNMEGLININKGDVKQFQVFGTFGGAMIGLGIAIAGIATALAKIASIKDVKIMWNAAGVIAALVVVLGVIIMAITYFTQKYKYDEAGTFGGIIWKIAFGIAIIAVAVRLLVKPLISIADEMQKVGGWNVLGAFLTLAGIIAAYGTLEFFIGKYGNIKDNGSDFLKVAASMVVIAFAVRLMMGPIQTLSELIGTSYDSRVLLAFAGVVVLMAAYTGMVIGLNKLGNVKETGTGLLKAAASMIIIAFAVRLLVGPIERIANMKGNLLVGFGVLLGIMVLLGAITAAATLIKDPDKLLKVAKAVGILAAALAALMIVLGLFGAIMTVAIVAIPWELLTTRVNAFKDAINGMAKTAGILILFGVAAALIGAGVLMLGTGLMEGALGFIIFSFALGVFSTNVLKVLDVIPAFLEKLKGIGELLKSYTLADWGSMALGAAAIVVFALAVGFLISQLVKLLNMENVQKKLLNLGKSLASGLSTLMSDAGQKIMSHLPEIGSILVTLITIVGMYMLGLLPTLIDLIGSAILTLVESIYQFVRANKQNLEHSVFGTVAVIIETLYDALMWSGSVVSWLITDLLQEILNGIASLVENIPGIGPKIADKIRGLTDYFPTSEDFMNQWELKSDAFAEKIETMIPPAGEIQHIGKQTVDELGLGFEQGVTELKTQLATYKDLIPGTVKDIATESGNEASTIPLHIADGINTNANLPAEAIGYLKDAVNENMLGMSAGANEAGAAIPIETANGINENATAPLDSLTTLKDYCQKILGYIPEGAEINGENAMTLLSNGMNTGSGAVFGTMSDLQKYINEYMETYGDNAEISGENSMILLSNGMADGSDKVFHTMAELQQYINEYTAAFGEGSEIAGQNMMVAFNNGAVDGFNEGDLTKNVDTANKTVLNRFNSLPKATEVTGNNIFAGLNNGMVRYWNNGTIQSNIDRVGAMIINRMNYSVGVHSPSRFTRKTGQFFMQGLGLGVEDEEDGIITQVVGFGEQLINAIGEAMSLVGMIANDDFDISPRITPIVDLSNFDQATNSINDAFSQRYGVSAEMSQAIGRRLRDAEDIASNISSAGDTISNNQFTFNIYAAEGMDENDIADAVMAKMQSKFARRSVAFG